MPDPIKLRLLGRVAYKQSKFWYFVECGDQEIYAHIEYFVLGYNGEADTARLLIGIIEDEQGQATFTMQPNRKYRIHMVMNPFPAQVVQLNCYIGWEDNDGAVTLEMVEVG